MASHIIMAEQGVHPKARKKNIEGEENREAKRSRIKIAADAVVYEQDTSQTIAKTIGDGSGSQEVVNDISQKPTVPDEACFSGTEEELDLCEDFLCFPSSPEVTMYERKPRQLTLTCPPKERDFKVDFWEIDSCETVQDALKAGHAWYV